MNKEPPDIDRRSTGQRVLDGIGCIVKLGYWLMMAILISDLLAIFPNGCFSFKSSQEKARLMQACSNARQIIITLKNYAAEHGGHYPDEVEGVKTSNDVFRVLFKNDLIEDERAFTAYRSPYEGDDNIGESPDYTEALKHEENHWSLVAGMKNGVMNDRPLIFENSVNFDQWPPMWNCDKAGQKVEGRAWKSGKIIIGHNDGSVAAEPLEAVKGGSVGLRDEEKFFPTKHEGMRILDVAR